MATIFSRIIAGEIPCYKVAENEKFFAFLDINPLVKGHTLVVPKQEVDYIFDLSDEDLAAMHVFAKQVACAIKKHSLAKGRRSCYRTGSTPCTYSFNSYSKGIGYVVFESETEIVG